MTIALAAAGPSAFWYLTRGTGAVALILLSLSMVLGIVDQRRWRSPRWPRFVVDELHRNVSLLALAFLAVHILTSVLDGFAPIRLVDAVLPFAGAYRPVWLGLGALAFDLLLAVAITSMLRRRIGHGAWRIVHWLAYACWPVAALHSLGTGSDVKSAWMMALTATCVAAVWLALWVRIAAGAATAGRVRWAVYAPMVAGPLALAVWLPQGPLGSGWARRAGTPSSLLGSTKLVSRRTEPLPVPFSGDLDGTIRQGQENGLPTVDLAMRFHGPSDGVVDMLLMGQQLSSGGLSVTRSRVTLGTASKPNLYSGRVLSLDSGRAVAEVRDRSGSPLRLDLALAVNSSAQTVGGTISGKRAQAGDL